MKTEYVTDANIGAVIFVPLDRTIDNRDQAGEIDNDKVVELAESLQRNRDNGTKGLLQVPLARPLPDGRYELAYQPQAGEMMFIFSNSGVNLAPVEMALLAKEHGLISVAVCSLAYARVAPLSSAGRRLFEVTDYVIDNGGEQGDSLIPLEGTPWRVGPSSTVINALLWNALVTEVAFSLQARGMAVPVFGSSNLPGGVEHNAALLQKWRGRNPHI